MTQNWHEEVNLGSLSAKLALYFENPTVIGGFHSQRASKAGLWYSL